MTVPSWIERGVKPELNDGEEIVDAHEVDSTLTSKIALVATNKRTLFVRDPMLGAAKVQAFRLKLPGGLTDGPTGTVAPPSKTIEQPTEEKTWTEVDAGAKTAPVEQAPAAEVSTELTRIKGVGSSRAGQLASAGITSFPELITADTAELADQLGVAESQVETWQAQADLTAINGIAVTRAGQLVEAGVTTVEELLEADAGTIAETLDVGVEVVEAWQAQADLTSINGIGPKRAFRLRRAGVATVRQLAATDPTELAEVLDVDQGTVKGWQEAALESALELTDLTSVKGIGSARARTLFTNGITSRARLASANAGKIAEALGVSTDQVEAWQAAASEDA